MPCGAHAPQDRHDGVDHLRVPRTAASATAVLSKATGSLLRRQGALPALRAAPNDGQAILGGSPRHAAWHAAVQGVRRQLGGLLHADGNLRHETQAQVQADARGVDPGRRRVEGQTEARDGLRIPLVHPVEHAHANEHRAEEREELPGCATPPGGRSARAPAPRGR